MNDVKLWGWDKKKRIMLRFVKNGIFFCFQLNDYRYCFGGIIANILAGRVAELFDFLSPRLKITEGDMLGEGIVINRHIVNTWLAATFLVLAFSAQLGYSGETPTLPEAWIADPDGLQERFVSLFDEGMRPLLRKLTDDAVNPKEHYRADFIRYMALVATLAEDADARLFFLIEGLPKALSGERREREKHLPVFLGEMHFRTELLLNEPNGVGDGTPEYYEFTRSENGSTLFLDRTPHPGYNRWTITYTARAVSPGDTAGAAVHDAGDRYGTYPGASFMRVKEGRILFTTPKPAFDDFFTDPAKAPRHTRDGLSFYPIDGPVISTDCPEEDEREHDGAEMVVFFDDIADDFGRMRASLFQINRDAYVPAVNFTAQCVLFYEWDGTRYAIASKECAREGEWGMSR